MKRCGIDIQGNCSTQGDITNEMLCKSNDRNECAYTIEDEKLISKLKLFFTKKVQNELFRLQRSTRLPLFNITREADMNKMMHNIISEAYKYDPKLDAPKIKKIKRDPNNPKKKIKSDIDKKAIENKVKKRKRKWREGIVHLFNKFPLNIKQNIVLAYKDYIARLDLFVLFGTLDFVKESLLRDTLLDNVNPCFKENRGLLKHFTNLLETKICGPLRRKLHSQKKINTNVLNKFKGLYYIFNTKTIKHVLEHCRMRDILVKEGLFPIVFDINRVLFYTSPFLTRSSRFGKEKQMIHNLLKKYKN